MSVTSFPSSSRTDGPLGGDESRAFSSALADLAERWGRGEPAAADQPLQVQLHPVRRILAGVGRQGVEGGGGGYTL